ncbi:DUF4369 domain-containing protein [Winogradskyella maritima]|nr:DUF4369 domain-containing protein [Winogradskyella maritima]
MRAVGENGQPVDVDTTTVENGKFSFTGKWMRLKCITFLWKT